ncbi:uncharacterized protein LOC128555234 [Mercenaria mercenaria]|uniref:uncharacterized protein LOC128555234 n=1 Tax=Mercenaria mercenaria TaxID=6596 RepID=UPI00234F8593|nr:uncharacterized protein LOC128555234 [Mercenaria mercenaria]
MPGKRKASRGPNTQAGAKRNRREQEEVVEILAPEMEAQPAKEVWVLGDSIVHWAGERAVARNAFKENNMDWDGKSGMTVQELHSAIQYSILQGKTPTIIVLHVGGNNISSSNTCQIISIIKKAIDYLFLNFPESIVVWTYILPRLNWRNTPNTLASAKIMDLKRKNVNRKIRNYILQHSNGRCLNHKSLNRETPGFFRRDGIHLSDVGNDMYILTLSEAINTFKREKDCKELHLG